jgi:hypothetical protein
VPARGVDVGGSDRRGRGGRHDWGSGGDGRVKRVLVEEGLEVLDDFLLGDCEIVVEEVEELLFHEVNLGLGEHLGVAALGVQSARPGWMHGRQLTQCLFLGEESFRYLAATMRVARNTR